jgi:hypothetical protein
MSNASNRSGIKASRSVRMVAPRRSGILTSDDNSPAGVRMCCSFQTAA